MRFLLDFPFVENRIKIWMVSAYLKKCSDTEHSLHREFIVEKEKKAEEVNYGWVRQRM